MIIGKSIVRNRKIVMPLMASALAIPAAAVASTPTLDPNLVNALSAINTAPVIVQQVNTAPDADGKTNLDVLKVIQPRDASSPYTYLGVYHRQSGKNPTAIGVAGSNDLRSWTVINGALDGNESSQPDITKLPDNSYLVIYENDPSAADKSKPADPNFRIRHYANYAQLSAGNADRQFDFENTLSSTHCAEGTPNFRKITYNGSVDNSVIELGFHYCNYDSSAHVSVPDSAARGTLTNFRLWKQQDFTTLNTAMRQAGVGSVGQMATFQYQGNTYDLLEGQTIPDDFGAFKLFLYNEDSNYLQKLNVTSPGGSVSIANPRIGIHYNASGTADGVIGSYSMLFASSPECIVNGVNHCAGTGEGGTFLFQQNLSGALADGSASFTPSSYTYYPVNSICTNGCQGVLLAGRDLATNANNATSDIGGTTTTAGSAQGYMVYGPYLSTLPALPLTAVFKLQIDSIANANQQVASLEVVDATTGTVITSRPVYRKDLHHSWVYSNLMLPFDWSTHAGHQVELRVWSYGVSYIKVASVSVYQQNYTFFCPGALAVAPIAHSTGSSCVSNSPTSNGTLVYGPYYADFPGTPTTVSYSLRANSLTASGTTAVGAIDVHAWNPNGQEAVLATASILANQVDGNYRTFNLNFDPTYYIANGWSIETRVFGWGKGNIETQYTYVTPHQ